MSGLLNKGTRKNVIVYENFVGFEFWGKGWFVGAN
jgi:hypothetical protein